MRNGQRRNLVTISWDLWDHDPIEEPAAISTPIGGNPEEEHGDVLWLEDVEILQTDFTVGFLVCKLSNSEDLRGRDVPGKWTKGMRTRLVKEVRTALGQMNIKKILALEPVIVYAYDKERSHYVLEIIYTFQTKGPFMEGAIKVAAAFFREFKFSQKDLVAYLSKLKATPFRSQFYLDGVWVEHKDTAEKQLRDELGVS